MWEDPPRYDLNQYIGQLHRTTFFWALHAVKKPDRLLEQPTVIRRFGKKVERRREKLALAAPGPRCQGARGRGVAEITGEVG